MAENFYKPSPIPVSVSEDLAAYLANEIDKVRRSFEFVGNWEQVTPQWIGASSNPAIGNGTLVGWYRRLQDQVDFRGKIVMGSTTTFGSGVYTFAPPAGLALNAVGDSIGSVQGYDGGTAARVGACRIIDGESALTIWSEGVASQWSPTVPHTWANTDEIRWSIRYTVAP